MKTLNKVILIVCLSTLVGSVAFSDTIIRISAYTPNGEFLGNKVTEHEDTTTFWLSQDKVRVDATTGNSFILDEKQKIVYLIHHKFKIYQVIKLDVEKPTRDSTGKPIVDFESGMEEIEPQVESETTPVDSSKVVNGFKCRKFILEESVPNAMVDISSRAEIWASEDIKIDLNRFYRVKFGLAKGVDEMDKYANQFRNIKGFPIVTKATVHFRGEDGRQSDITTTENLLDIKESNVPEGTFDIPAGYDLYGDEESK